MEGAKRVMSRLAGKRRIGYIGWLNRGNLGDTACYEAVQQLDSSLKWTKVLTGWRLFSKTDALGLNSRQLLRGVVLGGGTMISTGTIARMVARLLEHGHRLSAFGTGVGASGWNCEPNPDLSGWKPLLSQFDQIYVRGPLSQARLLDMGLSNVRIVGDLALGLALRRPLAPDDPPVIAVNLMVPPWQNSPEQSDVARAILRYAQRKVRGGFRILPLCMAPDDLGPTKWLCSRLNIAPRSILYPRDARTLVRALGRCSALVGVRLHSAILATCAGVPCFLLGYRDKCIDFMASIKLQDRVVDVSRGMSSDIDDRMIMATEPPELTLAVRCALTARAQHWRSIQEAALTSVAESFRSHDAD
jgi:hypothetical protein